MWGEEGQRELVRLSNHLDFGAATLAKVYKERWQIELSLKAFKQNLRIKSYVGTSENALLIQIWTALIALLRLNLFTCRDWLDDPYQTPPLHPEPEELDLAFL